jgi:hypothetical protein
METNDKHRKIFQETLPDHTCAANQVAGDAKQTLTSISAAVRDALHAYQLNKHMGTLNL